ncbi:MAG: thioredoxin family protein [Clostridiales bacterium]|jgi:thioredoxin 1|nr:thioredoxin family protein [Clostridiales bacterium]
MTAVDKETFQAEVLDAQGLVLVDFFGDGCVPCQALMPDVEELSEKYGTQVKFVKLNTSGARRLAISQKVLGLPTITLYKDGAKAEEVTKDDATKGNIEAMILKHIS